MSETLISCVAFLLRKKGACRQRVSFWMSSMAWGVMGVKMEASAWGIVWFCMGI